MALQSSGQISLGDIATEFGGTAPHSLSEYYSKGNAPASGEIQIAADFYGTSSCTTFTAGTTYYQANVPPQVWSTESNYVTRASRTVASSTCSGSAIQSRMYVQVDQVGEEYFYGYVRSRHNGTVYQTGFANSSGFWTSFVTRSGIAPGDTLDYQGYNWQVYPGKHYSGWEVKTGNSGTMFTS